MARQATNTILSTLDLSASKKQNVTDKASQQRSKLLKKLDEQVLAVQAALKGEEYFGKKTVKKTDEEGNQITVTVPKRVKKWFYTNNGTEWYFEVRYGNRVLQLAPNKTAITVGELTDMVAVIEKVKEAVIAKELDKAIAAVATRVKAAH